MKHETIGGISEENIGLHQKNAIQLKYATLFVKVVTPCVTNTSFTVTAHPRATQLVSGCGRWSYGIITYVGYVNDAY